MSKKGIVHPDTTKIRCAYQYASLGNYSEVARQTKIKRTSIMNWAGGNEVWADALIKARQEISDELLAQNLALATAANEEIADRIKNGDHKLVKDKLVRVPMNGKDLAIVSGIKEDKGRVAMGLPNVIKGNSESIKSMTAMFEDIAAQVQERLAKQANSIAGTCEEVE